jgi:hypothetical protein
MMTMTPRSSKFMLTTHITFSLGWTGTVAAFLALALAGLIGNDQMVRASYIAMELIAWFVIVPFCFASLLTGLIQSLGTHWGLFKYYWIVVKLFLTLVATIVLMLHMQPISHVSKIASETILSYTDLRDLRIQLVADAGAALLVLLATTTISVYKPWGKIEFGLSIPRFESTTKKPLGKFLLIGFILVVILFIILHLVEGGLDRH